MCPVAPRRLFLPNRSQYAVSVRSSHQKRVTDLRKWFLGVREGCQTFVVCVFGSRRDSMFAVLIGSSTAPPNSLSEMARGQREGTVTFRSFQGGTFLPAFPQCKTALAEHWKACVALLRVLCCTRGSNIRKRSKHGIDWSIRVRTSQTLAGVISSSGAFSFHCPKLCPPRGRTL